MNKLIALLLLVVAAPAHAKIVAEAELGDGAAMVFHDVAGPCLGDAKLVQYVSVAGEITPGCYVVRGPRLMCVFFDGDISAVPIEALKPPKEV